MHLYRIVGVLRRPSSDLSARGGMGQGQPTRRRDKPGIAVTAATAASPVGSLQHRADQWFHHDQHPAVTNGTAPSPHRARARHAATASHPGRSQVGMTDGEGDEASFLSGIPGLTRSHGTCLHGSAHQSIAASRIVVAVPTAHACCRRIPSASSRLHPRVVRMVDGLLDLCHFPGIGLASSMPHHRQHGSPAARGVCSLPLQGSLPRTVLGISSILSCFSAIPRSLSVLHVLLLFLCRRHHTLRRIFSSTRNHGRLLHPQTKGTSSFGKRHNKSHTLCVRCGKSSYHIQKKVCASCGYPSARKRVCESWCCHALSDRHCPTATGP